MRRDRRLIALLVLVILLVAACSKPKDEAGEIEGATKGASALEGDSAAAKPEQQAKNVANGVTDSVAEAGPAAKGYRALNPGADATQAALVGRLIKLQSTSYSNPNTYVGVTEDTIKLTFSRDEKNCGVNVLQLLSQAGANFSQGSRYYRPALTDTTTANKEIVEAVQANVKYWNLNVNRVAADIPQALEVMKKYNKPNGPFYGRKLTYSFVDGGSYQCKNTTTAGAADIADKIKPFSVVTNDIPGLNGSGYHMSEALRAKHPDASKRPMHFGVIDSSDKDLRSWAPFVWSQFQSGTKRAQMSASWLCSRLYNKKAVNSRQYKDTTRRFALLYPNNPSAKAVAGEFKSFAEKYCGKPIIAPENEFVFSEDPARAADEGGTIMVKLKLNRVTSVIYVNDFLGAFFHIGQGAKNQDYRPEWVWTGTAYQDVSTVQRLFDQEMVDRASIGYTSFGMQGFAYGAGDPFWVWHSTHKVSPKTKKKCDPNSDAGMLHDPDYCRAPDYIASLYYSWLPLIGGLIFAGPNLTPRNVSAGLQAYPLTRYGVDGPTSDPQAVLVGAGPGQYYFIVDGSEFQWRSGYVSPPPESKLGWVSFPDCQRHYMAWPSQLAKQWEKGGPNYSAYCGNVKYAPSPYQPRKPLPGAEAERCSDTPSGKCEKDNGYPRWFPMD